MLTWWVPDFLNPVSGDAGASPLEQYLREFEAARSGQVRVSVVSKASYGKGGLLDLARSAQAAAPGVLPDLITLDMAELPAAADTNLFQPLDGVLEPSTLENFYTFARQAGQFQGRALAVPMMVDVDHVLYNRARVQGTPVTWADLSASRPITYVFPLGSPHVLAADGAESVQLALAAQLMSAGGMLNGETRQIVLEEAPLLRVLTFYSQAGASGVLPPNAIDVSTLEDCWNLFGEGAAGMADVSARRYLAERAGLKDTDYGPAPGWNGPAVPIAQGWALGIVAGEPARRRAAADLMAWLLAPERLGTWARAEGWLPTSPAAWQVWGTDPYYDFLQAQLADAVAGPFGVGDPQVAGQLQKAISAVLRDGADPRDVVRTVATPVPAK